MRPNGLISLRLEEITSLMKQLKKGDFFGSHYQKNSFGGVIVTDTEYTHRKVDWHYHENPYFTYLLQGKLLEGSRKETNYLKPSSLLFHNWQEKHYNLKPDEFTRGFHLELDDRWLKKHELSTDYLEGSFNITNPKIKALVNSIFAESKVNDDKSDLSIESSMLSIFSQLSSSHQQSNRYLPSWFKKLEEYIMDGDLNINLSKLSDLLGIHPVHLSREFHKYFKITLGQYIRYLRVNKAFTLLRMKKSSMTEICLTCGFYDQSHFIRDFKRIYKVTPRKFQVNLSENPAS